MISNFQEMDFLIMETMATMEIQNGRISPSTINMTFPSQTETPTTSMVTMGMFIMVDTMGNKADLFQVDLCQEMVKTMVSAM